MSTSQRVSRGFHRLGLLLAVIPLVIGTASSLRLATDHADDRQQYHDAGLELTCAQELAKAPTTRNGEVIPLPPGKRPEEIVWKEPPPKGVKVIAHPEAANFFDQFDANYDLKELGCSDQSRKVSWNDIINAPAPGGFSYIAEFLPILPYGLAISLGLAIAFYGVIRAIG